MSTAAPPVGRPATSSARLVLTLGIAGLLSGLVLVGVYEATLPTIRANDARALRSAVFEVVPGSDRLTPLRPDASGSLVPLEDPTGTDATVYAAHDSMGVLRGFAIAAEGAGFQDNIRLIYGFDPSRDRVVGMRVLESRETPGLGDKIYKDAAFVGAFTDLAVTPEIGLVKAGESAEANEVHAITGATISSRAVVKIVNGANARWLNRLPAEVVAADAAAGAGSTDAESTGPTGERTP